MLRAILLSILLLATPAWAATDIEALIAQHHRHLQQSLHETESWLAASGSKNYQGWRDFLRLDELYPQLKQKQPDITILKQVLNQFRRNNVGLNAPQFVTSQRALRNFISSLEVRASCPSLSECRRRWLAEITPLVPLGRGKLSTTQLQRIGEVLGWLTFTKQEEIYAEKVRQYLEQPNISVKASAKLLNFLMKPYRVSNSQNFSSTFMGMTSYGTSFTEGMVSIKPTYGQNGKARFEVVLDATLQAPNVRGSRGRICVSSRMQGTGKAVGWLDIDENGAQIAGVSANLSANVQILHVGAPGPLRQMIAENQVRQNSAAARAHAEHDGARRMRETFHRLLDVEVKKMQSQDSITQLRQTLAFQGTTPRDVIFASSPHALEISAIGANQWQLAAPHTAPDKTGDYDLDFAIHESAVINYMESYMGGKVETGANLFNIHKMITMDEPLELRPHDNAPKWWFKVSERRPIEAKFDQGNITLTINATLLGWSLDKQERVAQRSVRMEVVLKPLIDEGKPYLARIGDVQVNYSGSEPLNPDEEFLQKVMQTKLAAFFPDVMDFGGLSIPEGFSMARFQRIKLENVLSQNSWLHMRYRLAPES